MTEPTAKTHLPGLKAKSVTHDNELLYLVQGQDKLGRDAFYYVLVDRLKRDIFLKEVEKQNTDLRKYGQILISGFGLEPTADTKQYLKNKFNLNAL